MKWPPGMPEAFFVPYLDICFSCMCVWGWLLDVFSHNILYITVYGYLLILGVFIFVLIILYYILL